MRNYLLGFVLALVCVGQLVAQDISFSQPFFAPLHLGPSMAGGANTPRVNFLWRNQWPKFAGGFREMYFSYDQPVERIHGGAGAYYQNSRDTNGVTLHKIAGAVNLSLITGNGDLRIVPGIEVATVVGGIDKTNFFSSQREVPLKPSLNYMDVGVSLFVHSTHYMAGVTLNHLNQPFGSFVLYDNSRVETKITAVACAVIPIGGRHGETNISPMILYTSQADTQTFCFGFMWKKSIVAGSVYYRNRSDVIVGLGLKFDRLRIFYSYDMTVGNLAGRTGGAHEISLMLFLKPRNDADVFPSVEHDNF
ncbi:MAG TPA: PorP/SprF family type IX secretion system membrane protein [Bacteroidia bacterium]|nr:PorP/SprF family type IX secretion system membrane protein [Bacteroidia bacterium]